MRALVAGLLVAFAAPAIAGDMAYAEARALAERDEAALPAAETEALSAAYDDAIRAALDVCLRPDDPPELDKVIVVELDASGRMVRTWSRDDDAISDCIESEFLGELLSVPPRAPFYTFLELKVQVAVEE